MSNKNSTFRKTMTINFGKVIMDFSTSKIMGILNLTPDSFFDGGKFSSIDKAIIQTEKMLLEGADIIDIGAVSTRPGAFHVTEKEELDRLLPVLKKLIKHFPEIIISIDTYRSKVAKICIEEGASCINDISGGQFDNEMFNTIAHYDIPYVLMHIYGTPENMQKHPISNDIIKIVSSFFTENIKRLNSLGLNKIILDPGFGFGKTLECNYKLLHKLKKISSDNYPVLTGISRKSMINKILNTNPEEALNGTSILHTIALLNGTNILRVHDVKEAKQAIDIVSYYTNINHNSSLCKD